MSCRQQETDNEDKRQKLLSKNECEELVSYNI